MGMKTLYKLKDMLCQELDEIADKGDLGPVIWTSPTS